MVKKGTKVALLALGSFFPLGESVAHILKEKAGIEATLVNPRYITGTDDTLLDTLKTDHALVATLEDGILDGGFGEKIARYYGTSPIKSTQLRCPQGVRRPLRRDGVPPRQSPDGGTDCRRHPRAVIKIPLKRALLLF